MPTGPITVRTPQSADPPPSPPAPSLMSRLWSSGPLLLTVTVLLWSGNIIVGRAAHTDFPPIALTFWRWTLALLIVLPFAWRHLRRDALVLAQAWRVLLVLSVFGVSAYNALAYTGLATTTAVNASLLQSSMSPLVLIWGFLLFRERPSAMQLVGVLVSGVGVLWIIAKGSPQALMELRLNAGDGYILAALTAYAVYSVFLRKKPPVHPLSLLVATFAIGAACLVPFYAAELMAGRLITPGAPAMLALGYVAVFPSLIAYLCFNRGVELIGSGRAGQFIHLMPVFASALAVAFLGERMHAYHLVGAVIIGLGIVIASRRAPSGAIETR